MKYQASDWQKEFHELATDEALAGGSAGPGKSMALLMDPMDQVWVEEQRCRNGDINRGESLGCRPYSARSFCSPRWTPTSSGSMTTTCGVSPRGSNTSLAT